MRTIVRMWLVVSIVLLVAGVSAAWTQEDEDVPLPAALTKAPALQAWDTVTPLTAASSLARAKGWRVVSLAGSEAVKGDLVMQTEALTVAFASRLGKVLIVSTNDPLRLQTEVRPLSLSGKVTLTAALITAEGSVDAHFRAAGKTASLSFDVRSGQIVHITAAESAGGVRVSAPIALAMVPSFVGEDLIFDAQAYPKATSLRLPSEHVLLGLLEGESDELVMTWQGTSSVTARVERPAKGAATIRAVDFAGAKDLNLALLSAPGIWHREALKPDYLERDIALAWKPPFAAPWLTQLHEDEVKTTFEFRPRRDENWWRGGVGSYTYPTWFSGGKAMLSLGKSIPPQGESVIYFLERSRRTPENVVSPVDVVKRTLTGDVLAYFLDAAGRPTWFPQRENYVIAAATCATTDALKAIFEQGQEVEQLERVKGGVEDMYFYLTGMFERNARFYPFGKDMVAYLSAQEKQSPALAPYLRELKRTATQIVTTYDESRDSIRDMQYAHELGDKTIALASVSRPDNLQHMLELKQDWTGMGGALEHLARGEHCLTRSLAQQAGYLAATRPEAAGVAAEVRKRARACLDKPESYEIWANY